MIKFIFTLGSFVGVLLVAGVAHRCKVRVQERQGVRRLAKANRAADHIINRVQAALLQTTLNEASGVRPLANPHLVRSHLVWWWTTYRPRELRRLAIIASIVVLTYFGLVPRIWQAVIRSPETWKEYPLASVSLSSFGIPEATLLLRMGLVALFMYLWWRIEQFAVNRPVSVPQIEPGQRRPQYYVPVMQLVFHTTRAAERLALLQSGLSALPQPFSVRAAERAVRSAHSARFPRGTGHRRTLRRHAEKVAGALRAAEYQQHVDPQGALREISRMLTQITERCAEGRLGALLDDDDEWMRAAHPARGHDLLKMLAAGLIITAISAGALLAGLPDGAVGTLIGTLAPLLVVLLFRSQMPSGTALIDLFRSADRSSQ
ncbi:hypothetical protein [Streptomyces sp. NPDC004230]